MNILKCFQCLRIFYLLKEVKNTQESTKISNGNLEKNIENDTKIFPHYNSNSGNFCKKKTI